MKRTDYFKPNCPYTNQCKSKGIRCQNCANNHNKEDHYIPIPWHKQPPWQEPYWTPMIF